MFFNTPKAKNRISHKICKKKSLLHLRQLSAQGIHLYNYSSAKFIINFKEKHLKYRAYIFKAKKKDRNVVICGMIK
jgi:hypothetical protein